MFFQRFYNENIAQASFLIGCSANGEAIVVDPNRDVAQYIHAAEREGLRIVAVTETHIHADYVSGSRELASLTGAKLYLSKEGGPDWQYAYALEAQATLIGDGDSIQIGNVRLQAVHTPGHTPEHLSFLVIDGAATSEPNAVLTGDFIFAGDVGRPDLLEVAAGFRDTMRKGAEVLYASVEKFKSQPDRLMIWPGHGAGSACGKRLGGVPVTTLGYEKLVNPSLRMTSKDDFVDDILAGQPEPPKYFARMKSINKIGPNPTLDKLTPVRLPASGLLGINPSAKLLDVRPAEQYLAGSITKAIAIPIDKSFSKWAGSLFQADDEIVLIAENSEQAAEATKTLIMIGLEHVTGWLEAGAALAEARRVGRFKNPGFLSADELAAQGDVEILDVRTSAERGEAYLEGSHHVPLAYLAAAQDLPEGCTLAVHCASGGRAVVAASYLQSKGIPAVPVRASFESVKAAKESSKKEVAGNPV